MAKTKGPKNPKRKAIPSALKLEVLIEAAFRCGNPRCQNVLTLDIHHIEHLSEGGGDTKDNLLPLCPMCHTLHHKKFIPKEAIRHWKGMLIALSHAFDRRGMDLLQFLHVHGKIPAHQWKHDKVIPPEQQHFWMLSITPEGALQFAPLINAGLVMVRGYIRRDDDEHRYHVFLSEKGKLLVAAWMSGSEKDFREALTFVPKEG